MSQRDIFPSFDPAAIRHESAVLATTDTPSEWNFSAPSGFNFSGCNQEYSLTVESQLPATTIFLSGLIIIDDIPLVVVVRAFIGLKFIILQFSSNSKDNMASSDPDITPR